MTLATRAAVLCGLGWWTPPNVDSVAALILGTTTPDRHCRATAPEVAARLGLETIAAFDMAAVCSGFVYSLANGVGLIAAGIADRVLVIGAGIFSTILNPRDRQAVYRMAVETMVKSTTARLGIPMERRLSNIPQVGNTATASIPLALAYGMESGALRQGTGWRSPHSAEGSHGAPRCCAGRKLRVRAKHTDSPKRRQRVQSRRTCRRDRSRCRNPIG
jgi:3-oxoacyl-[acyl-carrier-protein] synthase III